MSPMSAEATVVRNYLDWMLSHPVEEADQDQQGHQAGRRTILDDDHYGLEKVKERIVEYLAVQQRVDKLKGPILCLVGPSGRRQDLARQVDGQGHRPRLHPLLAGRRPRRGRDPRPPADLHRLDARQDHPVDEEGQDVQPALHAGRDRQDGRRLPRRPVLGAARGAGPGAERQLQRPLSRGRLRPVAT